MVQGVELTIAFLRCVLWLSMTAGTFIVVIYLWPAIYWLFLTWV
jgi:hypothetical protein